MNNFGKEIIFKDYELQEKLGEGSFGIIYKVRNMITNCNFVIKKIDLSKLNKKMKDFANNEVKLLRRLNCQYIVKYFDSKIEGKDLLILMEYCIGGDLHHYIKKKKTFILEEKLIWKFIYQILQGLNYLHSNKILHRDLKPLNIFLTKEKDIKIGDLGVAKCMEKELMAYTIIGTPYYVSPEICEEKAYNEKSDIWALGCVIYELCCRKHPFEAQSSAALILKIIKSEYSSIPQTYSSELKLLIDICLKKDHNERPQVIDILENNKFLPRFNEYSKGNESLNLINNPIKRNFSKLKIASSEKQIMNINGSSLDMKRMENNFLNKPLITEAFIKQAPQNPYYVQNIGNNISSRPKSSEGKLNNQHPIFRNKKISPCNLKVLANKSPKIKIFKENEAFIHKILPISNKNRNLVDKLNSRNDDIKLVKNLPNNIQIFDSKARINMISQNNNICSNSNDNIKDEISDKVIDQKNIKSSQEKLIKKKKNTSIKKISDSSSSSSSSVNLKEKINRDAERGRIQREQKLFECRSIRDSKFKECTLEIGFQKVMNIIRFLKLEIDTEQELDNNSQSNINSKIYEFIGNKEKSSIIFSLYKILEMDYLINQIENNNLTN